MNESTTPKKQPDFREWEHAKKWIDENQQLINFARAMARLNWDRNSPRLKALFPDNVAMSGDPRDIHVATESRSFHMIRQVEKRHGKPYTQLPVVSQGGVSGRHRIAYCLALDLPCPVEIR